MKYFIVLTVLATTVAACGGTEPVLVGSVSGRLLSGPQCAAESDPPDPDCSDRPVVGATVVATTSDGTEIETLSDDEGRFALELPQGDITISFETVEGVMGTPSPAVVSVSEKSTLDLGDFVYDTGIR